MNLYDHHANVLLNKYFDGIESPEDVRCRWCQKHLRLDEGEPVLHPACERESIARDKE